MKTPFASDDLGTSPKPHAFFLLSGSYSSFVLCAAPRANEDVLEPMEKGNLWGNDCVQLADAAIFFGIGSDAINQALWIYLDAYGKSEPSERCLTANFLSQGEQVYLECLFDMTFATHCDQFFLPAGRYRVALLSWNLTRARDNFHEDSALFLENVHHELHFTTIAH